MYDLEMTWNEIEWPLLAYTSRKCENAELFNEQIRRTYEYLNRCPHRYAADAGRQHGTNLE